MAFLVIVHIPYMPDTESGGKERENKGDEDNSEVEIHVSVHSATGKTAGEVTDKEKKDEDRVEKEKEVEVIDKEANIEDTGKEVQVKVVKDVEVKDEDTSKEEKNEDGAERTKTDDFEEKSENGKTPGTDADLVEETEMGKAAGTDCDNIEDRIEDEQEDGSSSEENWENHEVPLTPLFQKIVIHKRVEQELIKMGVDNVDMEIVGNGMYQKFSFVQEDCQKCEQILNGLRGIGVCIIAGSSMSVFPSSLHESVASEIESKASNLDDDSPDKSTKSEEVDEKESEFKKSVKSRLLVAQVVKSVTANAEFTFDYLLLLILASIIACIGLVENSSVVLVASMLISPLMGPILAATFGQVITNKCLRDLGLKSEMKGLALCLAVGFTFGLISGGVGLHGAIWGSTDSWPTPEMRSRGMVRSIWVGVMIALPSGAGVAISVLGGNAGSLVGVAISASLLPPACNAGMLWAYSLLAAIKPPAVEGVSAATTMVVTAMTSLPTTTTLSPVNASDLPNITSTVLPSPTISTMISSRSPGNCLALVNNMYEEVYFCNVAQEAALLGLVSLLLTLINICCIIVMGILVLKIKEVAPQAAGIDIFWREDVHVARGYYSTSKGESSISLGKTILEEYQKLLANTRDLKKKKDKKGDESTESEATSCVESDDKYMDALKIHGFLQDVENSPDCQAVCSKLTNAPVKKVSAELDYEFNEAAEHISNRMARNPGIYLADRPIRDKQLQKVYQTIHHLPPTVRPEIAELRNTFKSRKSMYIEPTTLGTNDKIPGQSKSYLGLSKPRSLLFHRRKQKVKFQVTKVEEEQQLV